MSEKSDLGFEYWDRIRQCPHDDLDRDASLRHTQCMKCGVIISDLDVFIIRKREQHERE